MRRALPLLVGSFAAFLFLQDVAAAERSDLPAASQRHVDFVQEIKPLLEASCIKCHAKGASKGGLSMETRERLLKGGDSGEAILPGKSGESLMVEMVAGVDPENVMPQKGTRWTPEQVGLLRAWIDQGAQWPQEITFAKPQPQNIHARTVALPAGEGNPIDRILGFYWQQNGSVKAEGVLGDRAFARRAYLDAIGLLPTAQQLAEFEASTAPEKRKTLVHGLLEQRRPYGDHWLTFWNDLLRNDYRGTGFIDGGRKQISEWLYTALLQNKPYNQFVSELMNPGEKSEGFAAGIIWRGNVAAAMTQPMQAAQSVSQVFLGINLKCASCHDSFVSDWKLADAYGMAAVFAEQPMELVRCDKPTGQKASVRFLYPELGALDAEAPRPQRLAQLASLMTQPENGRLSRTLVNRLWARLLGRGLVEPVDDMDKAAWSPDLLDWLAADFEQHGYDLKHTLDVIMTSEAYALSAPAPLPPKSQYLFRGPEVRRLSAEQFSDAVSQITNEWASLPSTLEFDLTGGGVEGGITSPKWIWTGEPLSIAAQRIAWREARAKADAAQAAVAAAQQKTAVGAQDAAGSVEAAQKASDEAAASARWAAAYQAEVRHKVTFRKSFTLQAKPRLAYGTLLVTQGYEVAVNGQIIKPRLVNGFLNGRVRLYDFTSALQAGENQIAINIDSHTEKGMNDTERKQFPASTQHLNKVSGLACYIACRMDDNSRLEITSDESWRTRRAAEGAWQDPQNPVAEWALASLLPPGAAPADEAPGLEPLRRRDFANLPALLDPAVLASCSTAAKAEAIRASMLSADPLQVALDRPNREIVITGRSNAATTLQALELTNGSELTGRMERAGSRLASGNFEARALVERLYLQALGRLPTEPEVTTAQEIVGTPVRAEGVSDLLWGLVMLPEFQFLP